MSKETNEYDPFVWHTEMELFFVVLPVSKVSASIRRSRVSISLNDGRKLASSSRQSPIKVFTCSGMCLGAGGRFRMFLSATSFSTSFASSPSYGSRRAKTSYKITPNEKTSDSTVLQVSNRRSSGAMKYGCGMEKGEAQR